MFSKFFLKLLVLPAALAIFTGCAIQPTKILRPGVIAEEDLVYIQGPSSANAEELVARRFAVPIECTGRVMRLWAEYRTSGVFREGVHFGHERRLGSGYLRDNRQAPAALGWTKVQYAFLPTAAPMTTFYVGGTREPGVDVFIRHLHVGCNA